MVLLKPTYASSTWNYTELLHPNSMKSIYLNPTQSSRKSLASPTKLSIIRTSIHLWQQSHTTKFLRTKLMITPTRTSAPTKCTSSTIPTINFLIVFSIESASQWKQLKPTESPSSKHNLLFFLIFLTSNALSNLSHQKPTTLIKMTQLIGLIYSKSKYKLKLDSSIFILSSDLKLSTTFIISTPYVKSSTILTISSQQLSKLRHAIIQQPLSS
mmetsp:Transcript_1464/g.2327  ORF Transcript_1464/g.2327 Transcript_1464/m.2327 type:complete len:213 (+) Transcript_1464:404-1042(+)